MAADSNSAIIDWRKGRRGKVARSTGRSRDRNFGRDLRGAQSRRGDASRERTFRDLNCAASGFFRCAG